MTRTKLYQHVFQLGDIIILEGRKKKGERERERITLAIPELSFLQTLLITIYYKGYGKYAGRNNNELKY